MALPQRVPFRLVHSLLGLVLIVAGALKLHEIIFETPDGSTPALLLMIFSEAELLGGLWMMGGFDPARTWHWAASAFAGLAASSLLQALAGKCSCGCFGRLVLNPWLILVLDLAAVAALWGTRPPEDAEGSIIMRSWRLLGWGGLAFVIGIGGWHQADLVTVTGTVTMNGRPMSYAPLVFTGSSGQIHLYTDGEGNFRLSLVRPGLYAVSTPGPSPVPESEHAARRTEKRSSTHQSQWRPARPDHPFYVRVLWIEISSCLEYVYNINL